MCMVSSIYCIYSNSRFNIKIVSKLNSYVGANDVIFVFLLMRNVMIDLQVQTIILTQYVLLLIFYAHTDLI